MRNTWLALTSRGCVPCIPQPMWHQGDIPWGWHPRLLPLIVPMQLLCECFLPLLPLKCGSRNQTCKGLLLAWRLFYVCLYVSALGLQPGLFKEHFMLNVCSDLAKELVICLRRVPAYLLHWCYDFGYSVLTWHVTIIGIAKQMSKKCLFLYVAVHTVPFLAASLSCQYTHNVLLNWEFTCVLAEHPLEK